MKHRIEDLIDFKENSDGSISIKAKRDCSYPFCDCMSFCKVKKLKSKL